MSTFSIGAWIVAEKLAVLFPGYQEPGPLHYESALFLQPDDRQGANDVDGPWRLYVTAPRRAAFQAAAETRLGGDKLKLVLHSAG